MLITYRKDNAAPAHGSRQPVGPSPVSRIRGMPVPTCAQGELTPRAVEFAPTAVASVTADDSLAAGGRHLRDGGRAFPGEERAGGTLRTGLSGRRPGHGGSLWRHGNCP